MNPSYRMLEFPEIHRKIAAFLKTVPGFYRLEKLFPFSTPTLLKEHLSLVRQASHYSSEDGHFYLTEMEDLNTYLSLLTTEKSALSANELLEFKKLLQMVVVNRTSIESNSEKYPDLFDLLKINENFPALSKKLEQIVDDKGKILDDASTELRRLRKRKFGLRGEIQNRMNQMIQKDFGSDAVPERLITIRDGRFVIPVKSAYRKKVPAIVHQFSKTGETAYLEPEKIVALNNEFVEMDDLEFKEIHRILTEITGELGLFVVDLKTAIQAIGLLDLLSALSAFARKNGCSVPKLVETPRLNLIDVIHPSLSQNQSAVHINIRLGENYHGILISGPNAGGKTVALKTAGLTTLMFLSGIPIPANENSEIGFFKRILAEIGDEQNIAENLSTFSGHIRSLSHLIRKADSSTLILIDEIASSTEPTEGQALARAYLEELITKKARFLITTHFQSLKTLALEYSGIKNAFVEFDEENLQPLFKLHVGSAGNSFALKIASKFGLPANVISRAEQLIGEQRTSLEDLIDQIDEQKKQLILQEHELELEHRNLKNLRRDLKRKESLLDRRLEELQQKGIHALRNEIDTSLKELASLRHKLKQEKIDNQIDTQIQKAQTVLEEKNRETAEKERSKAEELFPGKRVFVGSLCKSGIVEYIGEKKVQVRLGILSMEFLKEDLFEDIQEKEKDLQFTKVDISDFHMNLDLRGKRAEEALKELEKSMDHALVQGSSTLEIIHGKGEGILRKLIWDYLKQCPEVQSYHYAKPEDGGQGKTILIFK